MELKTSTQTHTSEMVAKCVSLEQLKLLKNSFKVPFKVLFYFIINYAISCREIEKARIYSPKIGFQLKMLFSSFRNEI